MNLYRLTLNIDDEMQAETHEGAWVKFQARVREGYYGPTRENVEFIKEVREEEAAIKQE